ncbi:MAG: hypothetical protein ABSF83_00260 [Nitrososphaerales archaeon]
MREANGARLEEGRLYRISGRVESVFDFQTTYIASAGLQVVVYVPAEQLGRIRPPEVHELTITAVEEVESEESVSSVADEARVSSRQRFAEPDPEERKEPGSTEPSIRRLPEIERQLEIPKPRNAPQEPEGLVSGPVFLDARAYGHVYTKKNGQTGSSIIFRLPWRQLRTVDGARLEGERFYRASGAVEDVFEFQAYIFTSEHRAVIVYVPVKYADRIRPHEVHRITISSVEEVETKKPVDEIVDGIHVSSWRRFAKSKLVDEENGEEFGDGPPRQLNEVEKAWLAGVIDGEGSIFIVKLTRGLAAQKRRGFTYVPAINLSSSSEAFAKKVREVIGRGSVNFIEEKRYEWKDKWYYRGAGMVVRGLLPQLVPHLLIKKEAAERMLEYLAFVDAYPINGLVEIPPGYYEKADSLYLALKQANQKGKDPSAEALAAMLALSKSLKNRGRGGRATECRTLIEKESAWLAGVIDGEGSIFLSKVSGPEYRRGYFYRPQLNVSNSNRPFLVKVMEIVGEGTVHLARKGNETTKTRWEYNAAAGVLRKVLPQIVRHLIVKRQMAERTLEYFDFVDANPIPGRKPVPSGYYERLDELYRTIKKLNEKGKPASQARGAD